MLLRRAPGRAPSVVAGTGVVAGEADGHGPSTRAVHAGLPPAVDGAPLGPPIVMAAPFHLSGDPREGGHGAGDPPAADTAGYRLSRPDSGGLRHPYGYGRAAHPTFEALEAALGELEGGPAVAFASGAAALAAVVLPGLRPGDVLVIPDDGYPAVREMAVERLAPMGVAVRAVPTRTDAIVAAVRGEAGPRSGSSVRARPDPDLDPDPSRPATLVVVETPSNPRLDVCDLAAVAEAAHAAGARLVVDNTLATGLGQQPLALGADFSVSAGTKALAGHSDVLLGVVAARDPGLLAEVHHHRTMTGAVPGPFEAWLVHRSLATLELRLARSSANARAVFDLLDGRDDVSDVCHPSRSPVAARQMRHHGPLVSFDLGTRERAERFLRRARLVADATSFGGVHSTAERRARWGLDAVGEGFVRLSCGIEDTVDLLADVEDAL